jgi:hypothetical protein
MTPRQEELCKLIESYWKQAEYLVSETEWLDDDNDGHYYECPMCGGDGVVENIPVHQTDAITISEKLGCAGIQVFGIGNGQQDLDRLLKCLVLESRNIKELLEEAHTGSMEYAWDEMREFILHQNGPLEVNDILGIMDDHDPRNQIATKTESEEL